MGENKQQPLISYIAPAAPATRQPGRGHEAYLRPEVGFTPNWFCTALGIDFGEQWHSDPAYRKESLASMRAELKRRFPGTAIGGIDRPDSPLDLLTGTYGACSVAAIYGVPIRYASDNWPNCEHQYLSDEETENLAPPDLDANPFFQGLMAQLDWIGAHEGQILGYLNWQGILNNAQRLRGEALFMDMIEHPDLCMHLFDCICTTMTEGCQRIQQRQKQSGVDTGFFTVSNCLVNMVSPAQYRELLLPFDKRLAETFGCLGVHNCAWNANPYLEDYASLPNLAYIDMGMESDLCHARELMPDTRRALMYTPMDLANKSLEEIEAELRSIARDYGPCDMVFADIEAGTPDARVLAILEICGQISEAFNS